MKSALTIALVFVAACGIAFARYGSLDPCVMLRHDVKEVAATSLQDRGDGVSNALAELAISYAWQAQGWDRLDSYQCARALKRLHLGQQPLFPDAAR